MTYPVEFYSILKRVAKAAPLFAVLSVIGCSIGYIAGVRPTDLGVFVAMPLVWIFVTLRVIGFLISSRTVPEHEAPKLSKSLTALVVVMSLALFLGVLFLISAISFSAMSLPNLAKTYYVAGGLLLAVSMLGLIVMSLLETLVRTWQAFTSNLMQLAVTTICYIAALPAQVTAMLYRSHMHN